MIRQCLVVLLFLATLALGDHIDPRSGKVLVLGSGGLVGRHMVQWLRKHDYQVLEVVNRTHIDLREPGALDVFSSEPVSFVYFFACEVGGSKFLESSDENVQLNIIENNLAIYRTVFSWLKDRPRVGFLFTSSYLQFADTSYGTIKRLGERYIDAMSHGKSVRLWNVYGYEPIGIRSHVLGDWISECLHHQEIHCRTDGTEARQFVHVRDAADAMGIMMDSYADLETVTDLSSGLWTPIENLALTVAQAAPHACPIFLSSRRSTARDMLAPRLQGALHHQWEPKIKLTDGINELFEQYQADLNAKQLHPIPAEHQDLDIDLPNETGDQLHQDL